MKVDQRKAGALLSYLYLGLGPVISIAYTPFMLRLLGQSEYGLYNLVASVVSYLGLLNFGFGHAYIRYYSRFKAKNESEQIARLNGMFLIIFSVAGLIAVMAGSVLVLYTEAIFGQELSAREISTARTLLIIMVINLGFTFPGIVFVSNVTANEQFIFQKSLQVIKVIANPFLILPVLIMGYGSVGMVVAMTVVNLLIETANILFCIKKLKIKFEFRNFDFSLMREVTIFSSFIFINLIVNEINWNVDRFILGRFHGTVAVATYSLAAQLNTYYLSISTAISNVFIPRVNQMISTENNNLNLTRLFSMVGRVQFMMLALIFSGLIFFGLPFIQMWAGKEYTESYAIALVLIIPVTIPLIQNLGIEIQRAKNMHKFRSWTYLVIAIGNIAITIPLVQLFGGIGAAAGTALSLIVGNILIMNWYYHARVGLNMRYFWKQISLILPGLILPFSAGALINLYADLLNPLIFIMSGATYIAIYIISLWRWGMNPYERSLISAPLKKVAKKTGIIR